MGWAKFSEDVLDIWTDNNRYRRHELDMRPQHLALTQERKEYERNTHQAYPPVSRSKNGMC